MPPLRILIADDSAILRSALRGLFSGAGNYEIIEAENGTEALARSEQHHPHVIVLDFAMPGMDGLSVAKTLKKRMPEIPIVMYTMHWTNQLLADALHAGVRKLISKSDSADLVAAVRELIGYVPAEPELAEPTNDARDVPITRELAFGIPAGQSGS